MSFLLYNHKYISPKKISVYSYIIKKLSRETNLMNKTYNRLTVKGKFMEHMQLCL